MAIRAEPPAEISGSGTPSTGSSPSTTAMFTSAWPTTHTMTAPVTILANGSFAPRRIRAKAIGHDHEQREHHDRTDEPELLADDREDEVVVGLGQPVPLRFRVAQPDAEQPAAGQCPGAVLHLPAQVGVVALGAAVVEPDIETLLPGRAQLREGQPDQRHADHRDEDVAAA